MMHLLRCKTPTAVRVLDLALPLAAIEDLADYAACEVFVFKSDQLLGKVHIDNLYQNLSAHRLSDAIAEQLFLLLAADATGQGHDRQEDLLSAVVPALATGPASAKLPDDVTVSVVVATFDRPEQLRGCLHCLRSQISPRLVEIVVVDNHPASGLTAPIVAEFPGIVLVNEPRQGLAYARNAGFVNSRGSILIATDDDVTMPPDWIERLVVPFSRPEVGAVTGNVLPLELESEAQCLFEAYGGLGRGFGPVEADTKWFTRSKRHAAPTWKLGATANAAFRATMVQDPRIGLMDEALGPGMPSGVGEDTYLFYKIIKAGFTLVYVPTAFVWHTHRKDMAALRRQIYNYSKGHVSYHLTTLLRDGDWRVIHHLLWDLPKAYLNRIKRRLRGRSVYPVRLILLEIRGNLAGPYCLWLSRRRVRREGKSEFPPSPGRIECPATETNRTSGNSHGRAPADPAI